MPASDRGGNEYALRAGSVTRYPWGESPGEGEANCDGCGSRWDLGQTAPVGSFQPNAFGLYALRTGRDGFKATQTAGSSAAVLAQRYFGRSRRHPDKRNIHVMIIGRGCAHPFGTGATGRGVT